MVRPLFLSLLAIAVSSVSLAACAERRNQFTDAHAGDALRAEIAANPTGTIGAIHAVWAAYIASKPNGFDCGPSKYWLTSEQGTVTMSIGAEVPRCYNFAGSMLAPPYKYEVLRIEPVRGASEPEYRILTRFRDEASPGFQRPLRTALVTLFAAREGSEWKIAAAMPRLTRSWQREKVGPFTYIFPPEHKFSLSRAQHAAAFADSVATAFGVPPLKPLDYYIVRNGDAMMALYGYQTDTTYGTTAGQALPGIIVSGDSVFGEKHGHEIVHQLLGHLAGARLHVAASEGLPSWLGGTRTREYPEMLRALNAYLTSNPTATLDTVIARNTHDMHNPAAALLAAMVHERGGVPAIRQYLDSGPSLEEFKTGVASLLGMSWPEVVVEWQRRVTSPRK